MKWLCTILAFVVLTLSVQPVCAAVSPVHSCCDAGGKCEEEDQAPEREKDCSNGCNPFQLCGCCAFSVIPHFQASFTGQAYLLHQGIQWGTLPLHFSEEPVSGFWQPPRFI